MLRPKPHMLAAISLALACASSGERRSGERRSGELESVATKQTLLDLEHRLQAAARVEIQFEIESRGSVRSVFIGKLSWERDGALSWRAIGEFAGARQQLELRGDTKTLEARVAGESRWTGARPPALIEAVVIGLTRQGLLHNVAMLSAGRPPDHADGGAAEWVEVIEQQLEVPDMFGGVEAGPFGFQIIVSGQPVGDARLWLDGRGLPIERRQIVNFPEGEMRVTERYTSFVVVD